MRQSLFALLLLLMGTKATLTLIIGQCNGLLAVYQGGHYGTQLDRFWQSATVHSDQAEVLSEPECKVIDIYREQCEGEPLGNFTTDKSAAVRGT